MPKRRDWQKVYQDCKEHGVSIVACWMGMSYQRLVAELHAAGVAGESGCPTRAEIRERCEEVQGRWDENVRQDRWDAARVMYEH